MFVKKKSTNRKKNCKLLCTKFVSENPQRITPLYPSERLYDNIKWSVDILQAINWILINYNWTQYAMHSSGKIPRLWGVIYSSICSSIRLDI